MKHFALLCLAAAVSTAYAQEPAAKYSDQLIAKAMARHPGVTSLTVHTTPMASGAPAQERSADGAQLVSSLPLLDVSGDPVGSVSVAQRHVAGAEAAAMQEATAIRDEMRRHIVNAANLGDPVPYVPNAPTAPYAQQLTDQLMAAHPELLVMALHVATPRGDGYPIIASSIGRIGKAADSDDMGVIRSGKPATGAYGANKTRYGIELPMYDSRGTLIGALSVGYHYKQGDDEAALLRKAQALEAEMRARIPSLDRLYGAAL